MSRHSYHVVASLPCHPGGNWCQGHATAPDGTVTKSRRFEGDDADQKVNDAIIHHYRNGKWPREMEDTEPVICEHCGKTIG